ncbi:Two-component system response regulator DccR [hydrothermal vent metagenome]|uniref:Two-component system response regulator DccR n=1 Tax=hydrothermal vent metagenome TaxID=652676 RepID=A0A1W1D215_9ZZZZ
MYKILLCDTSLSYLIDTAFSSYIVDVAKSSEDIYNLTYTNNYDLYIMNYIYYDVALALRESEDTTTLIFIDEYYDIAHLKKAFIIGDDYLAKPLVEEELITRVKYQYKKLFKHKNNIITYKDFYYHIDSKQLYKQNEKIKLSPTEVNLLSLLLFYLDKPVSKEMIFERTQIANDGVLRVYISKLKKLGFDITYQRFNKSYTLELNKQRKFL